MIYLNIFKTQQKPASSDVVTNFHDGKNRLFQWNHILWINSITRHNESRILFGTAEKARLKGCLLLRLVSITAIKSYAQLLIALFKRTYLDWKPLGNFQDSQADFRKHQEKNVKHFWKFRYFQEQNKSCPIWLQRDTGRSCGQETEDRIDWNWNWAVEFSRERGWVVREMLQENLWILHSWTK